MDTNTLFHKTLQDLKAKIESNDPYEILMATALLRKLLIDGNSLINQVNRNLRLKIEFTINDRPAPTNQRGLVMWSIQDGFDPETAVPHLSKAMPVTKDYLLKKPAMIINGMVITVLDLIKFLSHVQGGVHSGNPKKDKEILLKKAEEAFTIGGMSGGLRSIKAIGRVVLKGLDLLDVEVLKSMYRQKSI